MSKCKAVLDSERITEIKVKTKMQEGSQQDKSERKSSDEARQVLAVAPQHPK